MKLPTTPVTRSVVRRGGAGLAAAALAMAMAGCGSSETEQSAATPGEGQPTQQASGGAAQGAGGAPGASGTVAAISGSTAQVQSDQSGQVAVTWTGKTTFTKQVTARLADLTVGDCVMVLSSTTSTSDDSGTAGTTPVAASSVRISTPSSGGTCAPTGFGGGQPGQGPQGMQGTPPSGGAMPSGRPEGQGGGSRPRRMGFGGGAFGKVTAVTSDGFTVASSRPGRPGGATSSDGADDAETTTVEVTVSGGTAYTTEATGSAADVKVGSCLRAQGASDDTGAITATTVALSTPVDGSCGAAGMRGPGTANGATGSGAGV